MRIESCIVVLLTSLAVFTSCSSDGDANVRRIFSGHGKIQRLNHHEDKKNSTDNATEQRSRRSISSSERTTVLNNFNFIRSLVGASDMNYLDYSIALEIALGNWTRRCNVDADVYSDYGGFVLAAAYTGYPNHATEILDIFGDTDRRTYYSVRSKYIASVAGSVDYCSVLTANGRTYYGAYLRAYGFSESSALFDENVQQYTLGPACTQCRSNVAWCYNSYLCRADCSLYISGCCQISNGMPTSVCTLTTTTTSTLRTTTTTESRDYIYNDRSGARGLRAVGIAILHGFLLFFFHCFQ